MLNRYFYPNSVTNFTIRPLFFVLLCILFFSTLVLLSRLELGNPLYRVHPVGVFILIVGALGYRFVEYSRSFSFKQYTLEEVAKHNTQQSCWLIVENEVFDVTHFLPKHPPGMKLILNNAGKDATKHYAYHLESTKHFWRQNKIGTISSSSSLV